MYDIFYGDNVIGSLAAEELIYFNGSLKQRVNEADTLIFSLTSNNPYLKVIEFRSGLVSVQQNGKTIFVGDIVDMVEDMYKCVTITCHGCLTWLKDAQIVHYSKSTSAAKYLSDVLSKYNSICLPKRKINMGYCDIIDSVSHDHSDRIRSASYLVNELIEECGGYLVFRYSGQNIYLDWLSDAPMCNQNIDSQNLIDLSKHIDGTNIVTRIYPWGKDGLTMAAPYYVADDLLEALYGVISVNEKFDDAETAAELKAEAKAMLNQQRALLSTIKMTAIDLSLQDKHYDSLEVAYQVQAISQPHGIEEMMIVQEKDINLNSPANSTITFGASEVSLTNINANASDSGAENGFSGSYNDLKDKPTIPTAVTEQTVSSWGFTKNTGTYSKPTGGIPKTDLSSSVQASLDKADTALQTIRDMTNVTLKVISSRLTNLSYTAKYSSVLGMAFVRVYGTVNADMNTGYDYDVLNIDSRLPEANAALAVKCGKNCMAFAKSAGVISVRPLESGIKGYDIYITGFWFV